MNNLKLYMVYFLGNRPCFNVRVANSPEEALTQCFAHSEKPLPEDAAEKNCRVEEVMVPGYHISVQKEIDG